MNVITQINESIGATPQRTWNYSYDATDRLTLAQSSGFFYGYGYDGASNLSNLNGLTASYDAANQLTNLGGTAYLYDANGNVIDDGLRTYTWDAEDRLVGVSYKGQPKSSTFRYDGLGRRLSIKNAQSVETRYLWCGDRICQSRNTSDGIMTRYFVEGVVAPGSPGFVYGVDQLGTVRDQIPLQGSGAAAFDYDPYGKLTRQTGMPASEMSYAGLFYDANSGLYLANYRAYDPQSARWISRDPIRERGGLNLYAYAGGNPISYVDPDGLRWQFSQSTGQWSYVNDQSGAVTPVGQGYSGTGAGRNNPAMENVPNTGPTPQGTYDIGPGHRSPNTGPNTMNLTPQPGTNTHGRDLFRIHGDNAEHDASHGCAIAPQNVRRQINNSTDRVLQVVP